MSERDDEDTGPTESPRVLVFVVVAFLAFCALRVFAPWRTFIVLGPSVAIGLLVLDAWVRRRPGA